MALEITASLRQVLPPVTGQGRNGTWSKQEFVVETSGEYPKKICCTLWGDKASALQDLSEGQEVKVYFDLESREYNGRWYTDVKAWKVEAPKTGGASAQGQDERPPVDDVELEYEVDDRVMPF